MNKTNWKRALVVWLSMMIAESIHGTLRTLLVQPVVGDFRARQIGVFTGSLIIITLAYAFSGWFQGSSTKTLLGLGCLWATLTLLFEVALGRLLLGLSWERLRADYDLSRGGLMLFGLLVLVFAPWLGQWLRKKFKRQPS